MKLISPSQFSRFRKAINDVIDTFMVMPVTLRQPGGPVPFNRVGEGSTTAPVDTVLNCLVVAEEEDQDAEARRSNAGSIDDGEVEIYFGYDYLKNLSPSLIGANGEGLIDPNTDIIFYRGEEYRVLAAPIIAPIDTTEALLLVKMVKQQKVADA